MICEKCLLTVDQIVYCDCFAVLCRNCFDGHRCGNESRARFSRSPEPEPERVIQRHDKSELPAALFRLRPYQQECLDAILEHLG